MHELNIVLIEPEIPQNTGNIARTCAATGARLHLVEPMGFKVDDKKLKRAGLDYWHLLDITYYSSTEEFFSFHRGGSLYYFSTKAKHRHTDIHIQTRCILFSERNPDNTVRIPMISDARSLNLSNSAAIGVYEVLRQWNYPDLQESGSLRAYNWEDAN